MEGERRLEEQGMDLPNFLLRPDSLEWELSEAVEPLPFVHAFLRKLAHAVKRKDTTDLLFLYDFEFSKLTEHFFTLTPWPTPSSLAIDIPETSKDVLCLYSELYYRYIHSRAQASPEQRKLSHANYCDFFDTRLDYGEQDALVLPSQWAWDIVDEFAYQFQAYWQQETGQEAGIWVAEEVLAYFRKLIQSSGVVSSGRLREPRAGPTALHKLMGYFALVGQVRVLTQLGDYQKAVSAVEFLSEEALAAYSAFPPAYISLLHHLGFSLLMLSRYYDAQLLLYKAACFISRTKQYLTRSYQYNIIMKKLDQICALLYVAHVLSPCLPEQQVRGLVSERLADRLVRLSTGDNAGLFEEAFLFGSPKSIKVQNKPVFEPLVQFREAVEKLLPSVRLLSFLRIYRRLSVDKLARLLGIPATGVKELLSTMATSRTQKTLRSGLTETVNTDLSTTRANLDGEDVVLAEAEVPEDPKSFFTTQSQLLHQLLLK
jgi:translation initiation factor 3 subunit L